ncbi:hypothetical protein [Nannocystis radixulma]|uniref:Uncharacterized protein n=1 Tax=Nannocystis radixulma TaxID=2995305 RepID=A0ABT5BJJ7_9BACT|nr:hypothetical protein [Nannocystis radixulma]MDC0673709.1 hypothetical protein [Nannocystis radixulma]
MSCFKWNFQMICKHLLLATALLQGCDDPEGAEDEGDMFSDDDGEDTEFRASPPDTQFFEWVKGMPPLVLGSSAQRACFLRGFNGSLKSTGDGASLYLDGVTNNWMLTGKGSTWAVRAACVSSGFVAAGPTHWSSQDTNIKDIGSAAARACFLHSVEGPVNGTITGTAMRGAMIRLDPSGTKWYLETYGTGVKATARCVSLGTVKLSSEKFWQSGQAPISVGSTGAPCFATRVFGNFSSPEDHVGPWLQNIGSTLIQTLGGFSVSGQDQIGVRCMNL